MPKNPSEKPKRTTTGAERPKSEDSSAEPNDDQEPKPRPEPKILSMTKTLPAPKKKAAAKPTYANVNEFMSALDHPQKPEIDAVRAIIRGASRKLVEQVKWNAPSFRYLMDLGAFNLRERGYVEFIINFPPGARISKSSEILEGSQPDRREMRFYDLADIEKKRPALVKVIKDWVKLVETALAPRPPKE